MNKNYKFAVRVVVYLLFPLLALLFLCSRSCRRGGAALPATAKSGLSLPSGDQAEILVQGNNLTVVSKQKTVSAYVPDHATVEIRTDGTVVTHVQEMGLEHRPYVGISMGDRPRFQAGVKLAYYRKLEMGIGAGLDIERNTTWREFVRLNASLSYAVYRNTALFVGVENTKTFVGGVQIKL